MFSRDSSRVASNTGVMKRPLKLLLVCCVVSFTTALYATETARPMKKEIIHVPNVPTSPLYSQGVKVGPNVYVTGMLGIDPRTNKLAGSTIQEQTRQAIINCEAVLRAAGATLENVVEVQVLLARPDDFAGLNEAYAPFFAKDPPIRSVTRLGPELPGVLLSIKMNAVIP